MEEKQLRELCLEALMMKKGNKMTIFCRKLIREFEISESEISAMNVVGESEDEVILLRQKIVKAGMLRLRLEFGEYCIREKKIVIEEELPDLGYWGKSLIFRGLGRTGKFLTFHPNNTRQGDTDPFGNPDFIQFVFR